MTEVRRRVLFVDDEPRVLQGLQRSLRPHRRAWDMAFAEGGESALALLAETPFDVVVTDMRMPGMDGATLLHRVREMHPGAVRIVLSGHTEKEAANRAAPVAHQFMGKPCGAEVIWDVVERACRLRERVAAPRIRALVGDVDSLPSPPDTYRALLAATEDPNVSVGDLARIADRDPAICAKLLHLVNSSFFGLRRRITSSRDALAYLGVTVLRGLALSDSVFRMFPADRRVPGFSLAELQADSYATAGLARAVARDTDLVDDAFTAGLLHDLGRLLLAERIPGDYAGVLATMREPGGDLAEAERAALGVTHGDVGAALLGLWGLPDPVVEAVALHHDPPSPGETLDVTAMLQLAVAIQDAADGCEPGAPVPDDPLLVPFRDRPGVADRLPALWEACLASAPDDWRG